MLLGELSYTRLYNWISERFKAFYDLKSTNEGLYQSGIRRPFGYLRPRTSNDEKLEKFIEEHPIKSWFLFKFLHYPIRAHDRLTSRIERYRARLYYSLFDRAALPMGRSAFLNEQNQLLTSTFATLTNIAELRNGLLDEPKWIDVWTRFVFILRNGKSSFSDAEKNRAIERMVYKIPNHPFSVSALDDRLLVRLYIWWTYERPNRPDPDEVTRHRELLADYMDSDPNKYFYQSAGQRALIRASDERDKMWQRYQEEDSAMLKLVFDNQTRLDI